MWRPERRISAAAALVAALTLGLGVSPVSATPTPPSWDEVEAARGDVRATEQAIAGIIDAVRSSEARAAEAARTALQRGEDYQLAQLALAEAETALAALTRQRDAAAIVAEESGMRAAQLITQLARAGQGDITTALLISDDADALLYRLGSMSKLTQQSSGLMERALADRDAAAGYAEQADLARAAREDLVDEADAALTSAAEAATVAEQQVAEQQATVLELSERLAVLTGRSAALERQYLDSIRAEEPEPVDPPPGVPSPPRPNPTPSPTATAGPAPSPSAPAPSPTTPAPAPTPSPSAPAPSPTTPAPSPTTPAPAPTTPAPAPTTPAPSPTPTPTPPPSSSVPPPNAAAVSAAIAFARSQLGDAYQFGASGPDRWDCSGLTMMAYAAGGYSIGGHSATMQYTVAANRGRVLPYAQAQPGDLIFYSTGGSTSGSKYHVAMYLGGGQMIEAPSPGNPVRIVTVRTFDRVPLVARPTG